MWYNISSVNNLGPVSDFFLLFNGIQGWWSTGFSYGLWIASLVASGFSVVPVASPTWKAYFGLTRSESPKVC